MDPITIVGGNVAGLSTAIALDEKNIICTVYEEKIWDKPCGGAFGKNFLSFLKKQNINIPIHSTKTVILGNRFTKWKNIPIKMYITKRRLVQESLIEVARGKGIEINLGKRLDFQKDQKFFSDLTIVATGINRFGLKALHKSEFEDLGIFKYKFIAMRDLFVSNWNPSAALFYMLPEHKGYAWVFPTVNGLIDIGIGGLKKANWNVEFKKFLNWLQKNYSLDTKRIEDTIKLRSWGIPIPLSKNPPFSRKDPESGKTFIGVGDVLDLAHPITAAGIENAFISGIYLAKCISKSKTRLKFDDKRYARFIQRSLIQSSNSLSTKIQTHISRNNILLHSLMIGIPTRLAESILQKIPKLINAK